MKISKVIVLVLLISFFALTVASESKQATDKISIEEKQDCTTTYYDASEDVYGYVDRERNLYSNCLYYNNYTRCLNTTGENTDCSLQQSIYNVSCIVGTEEYQSYEVTGSKIVTKNITNCSPKSFIVSVAKGLDVEKKEIDFSGWGVCINEIENDCLAITCGTLKGGSARNGVFNGCDGGKSCQKFLFCQDSIQVLYKASRGNFVQEDTLFYLPKLALKEVEE